MFSCPDLGLISEVLDFCEQFRWDAPLAVLALKTRSVVQERVLDHYPVVYGDIFTFMLC